jgi:single-strand DNA-binding protein
MWQKMMFVGNLGRDPEMRYTPGGQAVTNFSVAVNRSYTKDGQRIDETAWFRCVAWGRQAETVNQFMRKGSKVLVEGRLNPDPNTGGPVLFQKKDGSWSAAFEVTVNSCQFLDSKGDNPGGNGQNAQNQSVQQNQPVQQQQNNNQNQPVQQQPVNSGNGQSDAPWNRG